MTVQSPLAVPAIEWDDGVVFVFSWNDRQFFGGFVHLQISAANAVGSATQISSIVQQVVQNQIQAASDPQSWLDTVKNAARNNKQITITFEDSVSIPYTTLTNLNFNLQTLFSVAG
jgi:hypothetical protein